MTNKEENTESRVSESLPQQTCEVEEPWRSNRRGPCGSALPCPAHPTKTVESTPRTFEEWARGRDFLSNWAHLTGAVRAIAKEAWDAAKGSSPEREEAHQVHCSDCGTEIGACGSTLECVLCQVAKKMKEKR